jgi:hypothetical protein
MSACGLADWNDGVPMPSNGVTDPTGDVSCNGLGNQRTDELPVPAMVQ